MPKGLPPTTAPSSYYLYEGVDYQDYWTSADTLNFHVLETAIVRELLPAHGNCILDLGCGYGRMADCYIDRFTHMVMFDGSHSLLKSAQKMTNNKAWYIWGDVNHLPFHAEAFDCVLMVRVFQHLVDSRGCIQSVNKILCQGGHFIFNYSNKRNAYRIIKYLLGGTPHNPFTIEPLMVEANFFHHHPHYVLSLLTASGIEVIAYRGGGVFNKIVEVAGPFANLISSGYLFAPIFGRLFLAPWIFCQTRIRKNKPIRSISSIESLLCCPACDSDLTQDSEYYVCNRCLRKYPMNDGIIDMRIDR